MRLRRHTCILLALLPGIGCWPEAQAQLSKPALSNQVAELILQLRDLKNEDNNKFADIFTNTQHASNTVASKLVAIGYPAVPQLIDALTNRSPTRFYAYNWDHTELPPTLLTVDDCAFQILQRISGLRFWDHRTRPTLAAERNLSAVRADIESWYADLLKTGEKEYLIRMVEKGNADSVKSAAMLLERYPDAAADALIKGILAVKTKSMSEAEAELSAKWPNQSMPESTIRAQVRSSEAPRSQLLAVLANSNLNEPKVTQFLSRELKEAPDLDSRLAAASGLSRRGDPSGVTAMIKEWPVLVRDREQKPAGDISVTMNLMGMEAFLAGCNSPQAIETLTNKLASEAVDLRRAVINAIAHHGEKELPSKLFTATLAAIEAALIASLADDEQTFGGSITTGNRRYAPRICDIAGSGLARSWPDKYKFDSTASLKVRDGQRLDCQNIWRKEHGLATLPVPPPRTVRVSTTNATQVVLVQWAPNSAKPSKEFSERMAALQGKLVTVEMVSDVCRNFESNPEAGSSGLEVQYRKDEDLTGVTVTLRLLPGKAAGNAIGWGYIKMASLNQDFILDNSSSGPGTTRVNLLGDLQNATRRCVDAAPETTFFIYLRLIANDGSRK